jgi:hypothetical protein
MPVDERPARIALVNARVSLDTFDTTELLARITHDSPRNGVPKPRRASYGENGFRASQLFGATDPHATEWTWPIHPQQGEIQSTMEPKHGAVGLIIASEPHANCAIDSPVRACDDVARRDK